MDKKDRRIRDADGNYIWKSVPTTDWGQKETLLHWRQEWANYVNRELEKKSAPVKIDHRSYKEQGTHQLPTIHEGPTVRAMEKKGIHTEKGKAYAQVDLLILDEWLLRALTVQQAFDLLEIIEARTKHGATIFCTQYDTDGWYDRINADPNQDSPIADAIMDRIVHNAYTISIGGSISMRERHGLHSMEDGGDGK